MTDPITYVPRFGRVIALVVAAAGAWGAAAVLAEGRDVAAVVPLLFVVVAAWAVFWRPAITVHRSGVSVRNVLRTVELPWHAIDRVDTRYALTLHAGDQSYPVWAAPAPGVLGSLGVFRGDLRHLPDSSYTGGTARAADDPRTDSGAAALLVRGHWERLRDTPEVEPGIFGVRWHWRTIGALLSLAVAGVLGLPF